MTPEILTQIVEIRIATDRARKLYDENPRQAMFVAAQALALIGAMPDEAQAAEADHLAGLISECTFLVASFRNMAQQMAKAQASLGKAQKASQDRLFYMALVDGLEARRAAITLQEMAPSGSEFAKAGASIEAEAQAIVWACTIETEKTPF